MDETTCFVSVDMVQKRGRSSSMGNLGRLELAPFRLSCVNGYATLAESREPARFAPAARCVGANAV